LPLKKPEIYALVGGIRKKSMPTSEVIVQEALKELGLTKASLINPTGKTPDDILKNFNLYLRSAFEKSLEVLEKYESQVYPKALRELCNLRSNTLNTIETTNTKMPFTGKVGEALEMLYPDLWHIFLSRSNSRKQRGGKDFEEQLGQLLRLAGVPFDKQIRKYHSDFMLPSATAFNRDRTRCILLSAKRTLRERWQTVVNEIYETRCPNAFLCTADEAINQSVINRLREYNIHLVVWDKPKQEKFKDEPVVVGYSQLANLEISTFRKYWV
jgi:hypothetical protein